MAMASNSLSILRGVTAIGLLASMALVSPPSSHGNPVVVAQTTTNQTSNQPDLKAMVKRAEKLNEAGNYGAAADIWQQILAFVETTLGPDHPDVALSLGNLAELLINQEQYASAEPLIRRSQAIWEEALGPDHPEVATSINNLALIFKKQGKYAAAEALYYRSLSIREKALGQDHPAVALSLNNLGGLLMSQGKYAAAEPLYRRALITAEKSLGSDHPDVARSLNNLALLLQKTGQLSAAESHYRRSISIIEKNLGPDHPYLAFALNNLATLFSDQGEYVSADPLYRRSLTITEKAFGANHPYVARALGTHAQLLALTDQYSAAEAYFRRSSIILENTLGPDHPDVATSLNNLAVFLSDQGKLNAAEPLLRRSLAIFENALGREHPDNAIGIANLSSLLSKQGQYGSALMALESSLAIETNWLIREIPLLPGPSRSAQLQRLGDTWQSVFSLVMRHPPAARLALETRLNRQGLLPEIEQRQALLLNAPGVDRAKVEQLQALTQQLASVSLPAERRAAVREQRDKLQGEIYRQIPELQIQSVTTAEVAKSLPANGVLVEFHRYEPYDGSKPPSQRWGPAQYIALVLRPNGSISSVALGSAAAIEDTVHKGLLASAQDQSDAEAIWAHLSDQVLKPLMPQLVTSRQWFLSPDGELNRVPFAALPAPQQPSSPLAKVVELRLLSTGRDLLRLQHPTPTGSRALVMANPRYDRNGAKAAPIPSANANQPRSAELDSRQWTPLPASEREGQRVASLLGTELINGAAATTNALQRQHGPRVLHVASHGFFVADQESKPTEAMRSIQEDSPMLRSLRQEDPQLRSGLVLAGANQPDLDPNDDGYLTAAEAVNLNLKGTELVVLSACSTGQGEVRTGEGVYGLQRSLTVAGARSTLLSLWKVDDAATAEFMVRFYQRLKAGEGRSDALATVQQEFRSGKVISPGGVNWTEPYYWAAWQLVGDWRPIKDL